MSWGDLEFKIPNQKLVLLCLPVKILLVIYKFLSVALQTLSRVVTISLKTIPIVCSVMFIQFLISEFDISSQ